MALSKSRRIGKKFQPPVPTSVGGISTMLKLIPEMIRSRPERVPKVPVGPFITDSAIYRMPPANGLRVTWFGHASLLVEIDGVRLLVDPLWDKRASPVTFAGPKRFFRPTMRIAEMPRVDAILISHDHYDHLGKWTVGALARQMPGVRWITGLEVGAVLQGFGVPADQITELDWTESTTVEGPAGAEVEVTAVPTRHFSGRSLSNRNHTLWLGFCFRGPAHRVYCGADTGEWGGFSKIARQFGPFDLSMLEIGAFNELWKDIHLGPDGAVRAFKALGGGLLMPIHWGLFDLALHGWREPMERLETLVREQGIPVFSPEPGRPEDVREGVWAEWWKN